MKKLVVIGITCMFFVAGTTSLYAQRAECKSKNLQKSVLTNGQKEQMKEVRIKYAKKTLDLKNRLNELRAHQHTLVSSLNPDKEKVYTNIDKMTALKKELHLNKLNMRLEMHSFLTEEQLLRADARPNHRKGMRQGKACKKGVAQGKKHGKSGHGQFQGRKGMNTPKGMQAGEGKRNMPNLSEEQQVQMKELRLSHMKDTKALRDEAEEIRLKQKNLMTSKNPEISQLKANVNRLSEIQNQLAKKKFDHQLQVRKILDEDQLVLFLSRPNMRKSFHRGHRMF